MTELELSCLGTALGSSSVWLAVVVLVVSVVVPQNSPIGGTELGLCSLGNLLGGGDFGVCFARFPGLGD